jgi:hypothetical protein
MRRFLCALLLSLALSSSVGCILPIYSGEPGQRAQQLIFTSEDLRTILMEWERFWFLDMPSHLTFQRVHGGVI